MTSKMTVQAISVATDLVISLGGGLITAITATSNASFPNKVATTVIVLTSLVGAARTIQQMAKASMETEQAVANTLGNQALGILPKPTNTEVIPNEPKT